MRAIDYFDKGADAYPDRTAIIDRDIRYTYREARALSQRIARAMWAGGWHGDERVAIYSPNDARVLLCMLGLWRAGGVWVPINAGNVLDAIVQYMNYVGTAWLFYHSGFSDHARELKARVTTLRHFVCIDGEDGDTPSLERFIEHGRDADELDWADPFGNPEHLVGIVPTGGTTGPAKGV